MLKALDDPIHVLRDELARRRARARRWRLALKGAAVAALAGGLGAAAMFVAETAR